MFSFVTSYKATFRLTGAAEAAPESEQRQGLSRSDTEMTHSARPDSGIAEQ
jgi:hypothetical protein